jgi:uncharacterized membrane protein YeaQ/YmgE (transglycosylase-associated protein family)
VHPCAAADSENKTVLILALLVFGLFIGWLAQLALGMGSQPDGRTLIAGLVGSFVGGLLASLIAGDGLELRPSGFIGSFVGAVIVLAIWRGMANRSA